MRIETTSGRFFLPFVVWSALVAFFFPLAFFFETLLLLSGEVAHRQTLLMPVYWILLCGMPIFIAALFCLIFSRIAANLFLAAAITFSVTYLKLEYVSAYSQIDNSNRIIFQFVIFFLITFLFIRFDYLKRFPSKTFVALLLTVCVVVPYISKISEKESDYDYLDDTKMVSTNAEGVSRDNYQVALDSVKNVRFKEKPNFYIFLYDSLIPPQIAKLFMGLGAVGYEAALDNYFTTPTGVTLQDNVPSTESIENLLWLDMLGPKGGKKGYFVGKNDSPLTNIFRSNGYDVTTGFTAGHWGFEQGEYVNDYLYLASAPPEFSHTMLCIDNGNSIRDNLRGFGMCRILGRYVTSPNLMQFISDLKSIEKADNDASTNDRWHRVVENQIRLSASAINPQFLFLYTYTPVGHTWVKGYDFNVAEDRNRYRNYFRKSSELAGTVISDVVDVLKKLDPNAILVVAGDHGAYISRGSDDLGFQRVDEHSVSISVLKSTNQCTDYYESNDFKKNKSGYHTISTVVISLISCLANTPDLLKKLPLKTRFTAKEVGPTFEDFVTRNLSDEVLMTLSKQHE